MGEAETPAAVTAIVIVAGSVKRGGGGDGLQAAPGVVAEQLEGRGGEGAAHRHDGQQRGGRARCVSPAAAAGRE